MKRKPLRWGLLATGNIAKKFARGLATIPDEAVILAAASRDIEKATAFAREFAIPRAYGSYEELLRDPEVDAVYVSTPNSLHAAWCVRAARAGKHILCEKPAASNVRELEQVLAAVKEAGVFFMEAFMHRLHPQWAEARRIVASGRLGEVRLLRSSFSFDLGGRTENIRLSKDLSGGALMDVGCYCVSFSRLITGENPIEAKATARFGEASGVDEVTGATLLFPSGVVSHFDCATGCRVPSFAEIHGSEGSLLLNTPWFVPPGKATLVLSRHGEEKETLEVDFATDLYAAEASLVASTLPGTQTSVMGWDDSLGQQRTLDSLRASLGLRFPADG